MYYEEEERDPFEAFGDAEDRDGTQNESEEIDLTDRDEEEFEPEHGYDDEHAEPTLIEPQSRARIPLAFSWVGFIGGLAGFAWIGAAAWGLVSYYGFDALMTLEPVLRGGLIALALGPVILFWASASAAAEALKARRLTADLTRMAQAARAPFDAEEAHAQRLSHTVKTEINALNDAVATALDRLGELEAAAQRNAALFGDAVTASRENTDEIATALTRQRDALAEINTDLRGQTETVAHSIGRQVRLMREASKLVKSELTSAEDTLENHLVAFKATAAVMGERTAAFHHAADQATSATTSLNGTMSAMLDGLSEATRMTDAARKSSEQAVMAANDTAGALREITRTAVHDAKRAAEFIRVETTAMQQAANDTIAKLRNAAQPTRTLETQPAQQASAKAERLVAFAMRAGVAKKQAASARHGHASVQHTVIADEDVVAQQEANPLQAAARAAIARGNGNARTEPAPRSAFTGFGGWNAFTARQRDTAAPANDDCALVDFEPAKANPDETLRHSAIDLVTEAGVDLDAVLRPGDLERIAQKSAAGASARRRAVLDAAPSAVGRVARHVRRFDKAQVVANDFRARPDLTKSENKSEASELVRAYLLIDAALA